GDQVGAARLLAGLQQVHRGFHAAADLRWRGEQLAGQLQMQRTAAGVVHLPEYGLAQGFLAEAILVGLDAQDLRRHELTERSMELALSDPWQERRAPLERDRRAVH